MEGQVRPVAAYYDGSTVFYAHTEASDPDTFDLLSGMMDSPVVTVPATPKRRTWPAKVTWSSDAAPEVLTPAEQIIEAADTDEVSVQGTDVVINAPLLTWPEGQR